MIANKKKTLTSEELKEELDAIVKTYLNAKNKDKVLNKLRKKVARLSEKHIYKPFRKTLDANIIALQNKQYESNLEALYNQAKVNELTEIRDTITHFTSPYRMQEMGEAYTLVMAMMQLSKGKSLSNEFWSDVADQLSYEYNSLKNIWIKGHSNPDRNPKSFFYKIDFKRWEKALIKGAVAYVFTAINRNDLLYPQYKGKAAPEMMRLLTTALHYGFSEDRAFNYVRYLYADKVNKSDIVKTYQLLKDKQK